MLLRVRLHRWAGIALVLPFLVWTATGLLFHLKPGWSEAYEQLTVARADDPIPLESLVVPKGGATRLELLATAIGALHRVTNGKEVALFDARSGERISPLSERDAKALVLDAVARSPHRASYGDATTTATSDRTVAVTFRSGTVVAIDRWSASLRREAADTKRIDALYRAHYLQWTGVSWLDRAFAVVAILATWLLSALGVRMFLRPR